MSSKLLISARRRVFLLVNFCSGDPHVISWLCSPQRSPNGRDLEMPLTSYYSILFVEEAALECSCAKLDLMPDIELAIFVKATHAPHSWPLSELIYSQILLYNSSWEVILGPCLWSLIGGAELQTLSMVDFASIYQRKLPFRDLKYTFSCSFQDADKNYGTKVVQLWYRGNFTKGAGHCRQVEGWCESK